MPTAAIIGAGPAGSTAAVLLARAGWDVHLFEQHRFPRHKVCGECLSPLAIEVLERLKLAEFIRAGNPTILTRSVLVATHGRETSLGLPHPMWGISRAALDSALLMAAQMSNVTIHQPARVEKIDATAREFTVRDLGTNTTSTSTFDYMLIADGKAALGLSRPRATRDLGIKAHLTDVRDAQDAITLFALKGHYVGLAPVENGLWNVAMSIPARRVRKYAGNLDALWHELLGQNAGLKSRMQDARRVSEWFSAPLPRFGVRRRWPEGFIPIGNAAAALEPIGGEGIGLALRSAELAAEHLLLPRFDPTALQQAYKDLWTRRRLVCRAGALILSRPLLARLAVTLLSKHENLGQAFVQWTGKPAPL